MPSRESNTVFECSACHEVFDFEDDIMRTQKPCPHCGEGPAWTGVRVQTTCDFCSTALEVADAWTFFCPDFFYDYIVVGMVPEASKDDWCACETCKDLIVANDQPALTIRCLDVEEENDPDVKEHRHVFFPIFTTIHKGFFKHKLDKPPEKGRDPDGRRVR